MDAQRKKERERIQKEIDKLKESIQTLTKSLVFRHYSLFDQLS
jgi:hypothetical protein